MSALVHARTSSTPLPISRTRMRLVPAAPSLWRVLEPGGRVIGHLQEVAQAGGTRFRARRYSAAAHAFRDLGDFWSADDAVECLMFAR
ncbi:hypothetical protein ACFC1I_03735 [Microbacterium sp. NPDC056044]|uniref:hypothetical protein n=1 Tax=Microbacterium sp. NPDC056044 TaxID=3345690 RepID=UPI0035E35EFF